MTSVYQYRVQHRTHELVLVYQQEIWYYCTLNGLENPSYACRKCKGTVLRIASPPIATNPPPNRIGFRFVFILVASQVRREIMKTANDPPKRKLRTRARYLVGTATIIIIIFSSGTQKRKDIVRRILFPVWVGGEFCNVSWPIWKRSSCRA